jgi:Fe-S cluster assembly iron-binding protein IscA
VQSNNSVGLRLSLSRTDLVLHYFLVLKCALSMLRHIFLRGIPMKTKNLLIIFNHNTIVFIVPITLTLVYELINQSFPIINPHSIHV